MADSSRQREIGALVSYADTFVAMVVGLLYVPLLLRTIGQAEYGLYQLIGSIIAYLNIISSMLAAGVTRYYCKFFALGDTEGMAKTLGISKKIYSIANVVVVIAATILILWFALSMQHLCLHGNLMKAASLLVCLLLI